MHEVTIDLQNTTQVSNCDPAPGEPPGEEPLKKGTGKKLKPEQRQTIATAYGAMSSALGRGCGKDVARQTLIVTKKDGSKETFVDESSGCGPPPQPVAIGLPTFTAKLVSVAFAN